MIFSEGTFRFGNRGRALFLVALGMAVLLMAIAPAPVLAQGPILTANGGGVAEFVFDPGLTTTFGLGAAVFNQAVEENACAEAFDGIPIDPAVLDGDFNVANGHFLCKLKVPAEPPIKKKWLQVVITGSVTQGRDNGDGTVTLCGTATWVDSFSGEIVHFPNEPFALVVDADAEDGATFHYWDSFNSSYGGDFERVIKGKLQVKRH